MANNSDNKFVDVRIDPSLNDVCLDADTSPHDCALALSDAKLRTYNLRTGINIFLGEKLLARTSHTRGCVYISIVPYMRNKIELPWQ